MHAAQAIGFALVTGDRAEAARAISAELGITNLNPEARTDGEAAASWRTAPIGVTIRRP